MLLNTIKMKNGEINLPFPRLTKTKCEFVPSVVLKNYKVTNQVQQVDCNTRRESFIYRFYILIFFHIFRGNFRVNKVCSLLIGV